MDIGQAILYLFLIIPGFIGYSIFVYIIGSRVREFSLSILWSAIFALFSYTVLYSVSRIHWKVFKIFSVDNLLSIRTNNFKDLSMTTISFLDLSVLAVKCLLASALIGSFAALLLKNRRFSSLVEKVSGHTYHLDVWNDFFFEPYSDQVIVITKDDQEFYGFLVTSSEIESHRALILDDVKIKDSSGEFRPFASNKANSRLYIQGDNIQRIFQVRPILNATE